MLAERPSCNCVVGWPMCILTLQNSPDDPACSLNLYPLVLQVVPFSYLYAEPCITMSVSQLCG
jgi:hypothetical protein